MADHRESHGGDAAALCTVRLTAKLAGADAGFQGQRRGTSWCGRKYTPPAIGADDEAPRSLACSSETWDKAG